uniref:Uncharacterized protein n=1 Tax=viral metagenome TaxID=1070528 RepID=A0A6C0EFR4_9ZZZZ
MFLFLLQLQKQIQILNTQIYHMDIVINVI